MRLFKRGGVFKLEDGETVTDDLEELVAELRNPKTATQNQIETGGKT
jgi:molybdopterin-biosynthesis enzyme MoeA-like protein